LQVLGHSRQKSAEKKCVTTLGKRINLNYWITYRMENFYWGWYHAPIKF